MQQKRHRHLRAQAKRRVKPLYVALCLFGILALVAGGVALERMLLADIGSPQQEEASAPATTTANATSDAATSPRQASEGNVSPEPEATSAAQPATVQPATINTMMIGDVLMHDELVDSGYQYDGSFNYDFLYGHISPYIDAADLRILNQETVMGEPDRGYHLYMGAAGPIMNTPTAVADSEARFGFNLILKATNHTLDLGYSGLAHELDYWKANYPSIPVVGVNNPNAVGTDDDSQNFVDNVYVYEKDGLKVGVLNYTWATNENFDWDTDREVISYLSEDKIRADIEQARAAGAEMIIACPHWGIEYTTETSDEEEYYSKLFCDLGVDLIFGSHPHILQRVELLRNAEGHKTVCFYSLGNYVAASLMEGSSLIGGVAQATLERSEDGTCSVTSATLIPTVICHTYGSNMTAFPITEWTYDLAAQSARPNLTPDYAYDFVANVLGDGYDAQTGVYTLDLSQEGRLV